MRPSELLAPLAARGVNLSLDAMRAALYASGDPQLAIPCVHIAGTNGKGSVAAIVSEALGAQGLRVGRYTSPHLHRVAERVVIGGHPIDEETLCDEILRVRRERDLGVIPALSLFESLTLIAWRAFVRAGVEVAVMEVGVGGRLDATNLCAPRVTAITRIARDHTHWLGDTLGAIAVEKAGICKPGVPCVLGPALREGEAREAIEAVARGVGAPLIDADAPHEGLGAPRWRYAGGSITATPSLRGDHQMENVSVAVAVCEALGRRGVPVRPESMVKAITGTSWPGRMERMGDVILDAAHNEDGLRALAHALRGERVGAVVFGASRDKDLDAMAAQVRSFAPPGARFATQAPMERATPAEVLAEKLDAEAVADPLEALRRARSRCAAGECVVVCGSIFVVAEVRAGLLGIDAEPPIAM